MTKIQAKKTSNRMIGSIIAILVLALCLTITTFAIVYSTVSVEENIFRTGRVKINLNNGDPVIRQDEFLFEPGATVVKTFFVENLSTWDVYYKIYFGNVTGKLADFIEVTVKDGDKVICQGRMKDLSKADVTPAEDELAVMEKKELSIWFHFPEEVGNQGMNLSLNFDLFADAVQTKNNPEKAFN